jgi:primosomal protein N' (replication factor Y)
VAALSEAGSTLVILPDTRHVERVHAYLEELKLEHTILDSQLPKSEYYSNFLKVRTGLSKVVIGTRSAVFAPVNELKSLVIYNEGSENLYEQRSPGWNARDIALLRRQCEDIDLYFIGYSPSSEVARLIDEDWVEFKKTKSKVKLAVTPQLHGELLPSRAIPLIKRALSSGPVLFIVPTKGYAQAIRCSKCRTISRCECGGAHFKSSAQSPISCIHCLTQVPKWQCSWCNHLIPALASRGIERHQHEIGVLFPGTSTVLSSADHLITEVVDHGIVIATPGMAPKTTAGYRSVVILEGNRFLNQPDMRANERVREMYFAHAALASSDGTVILVQDEGHTIATALTTWNPSIAIHRDLEERSSLKLPPYVRAAILTMETGEITRLKSALEGARAEGRIPAETTLLGPVARGDKSALILTVDVAHGEELVSTLHEFMRRRSASKKSLPSLRIDPYSLSR